MLISHFAQITIDTFKSSRSGAESSKKNEQKRKK